MPTYTRATLERKLVELYPTDKIILVNYKDLSIIQPRWTVYDSVASMTPLDVPVEELYSKTSLSAPFLAVAKNEIIITLDVTSYNQVKAVLEWQVPSLGLKPNYLTIMASPIAIQMRKPQTDWPDYYEEVDNHIYGDIDHDGIQDVAVGRIMGLTPSDVSAYVARDIFFEDLKTSKNFASLWPYYFSMMNMDAKTADKAMSHAGFIDSSVYLPYPADAGGTLDAERDLKNKVFIGYYDHANPEGWGGGIFVNDLRNDRIKLDPSIVLSNACLTCAYNSEEPEMVGNSDPSRSFCTNILRHGAMAHIGAVEEASVGYDERGAIIANEMLQGRDIGQAFLRMKNIEQIYNMYLTTITNDSLGFDVLDSISAVSLPYEMFYVLLGDPN